MNDLFIREIKIDWSRVDPGSYQMFMEHRAQLLNRLLGDET